MIYNRVKWIIFSSKNTSFCNLQMKYPHLKCDHDQWIPDQSWRPPTFSSTSTNFVLKVPIALWTALWYCMHKFTLHRHFQLLYKTIVITGMKVFCGNAEISFFGSHFGCFWDRCKSVEKLRLKIWGGGY